MPISSGKYVSPTWENGHAPAINQTELQAMTDTIANSQVLVDSVTLTTTWLGSGPYNQTVTLNGGGAPLATQKVDLQPTAAQLQQIISDGVAAITIENNSGTLVVYAIGNAPTVSMTVQVTITGVV